MSWMGASGSFESRARKAFGGGPREGTDVHPSGDWAASQANLQDPLHSFSSRAKALFGGLDSKSSAVTAIDSGASSWVVGIDAEAAEAAAQVAGVAAQEAAAATSLIAANTWANTHVLHDHDDSGGADGSNAEQRPPLHTAVLDDNAYDRHEARATACQCVAPSVPAHACLADSLHLVTGKCAPRLRAGRNAMATAKSWGGAQTRSANSISTTARQPQP